jgi:hypothetical protein
LTRLLDADLMDVLLMRVDFRTMIAKEQVKRSMIFGSVNTDGLQE